MQFVYIGLKLDDLIVANSCLLNIVLIHPKSKSLLISLNLCITPGVALNPIHNTFLLISFKLSKTVVYVPSV